MNNCKTVAAKNKKHKQGLKYNNTVIPAKDIGKVMAELITAFEGGRAYWQNKSC